MTGKRFTSYYNGDESLITPFLENGKPMTKQEVLNRLNELHEKNKLLLRKNGAMEEEIECLSDENEQLKVILSTYMKQIDKLCIKKGLLEQQLSSIDKLIDDLGSEEMRRQYKIIIGWKE